MPSIYSDNIGETLRSLGGDIQPQNPQGNISGGGGGGGLPAGANTQVQFNDNGIFGGSSNLSFNKDNSTLYVVNLAANGNVTFSNVANFHVPGGAPGSVLGTDGNGNLYWANGGGADYLYQLGDVRIQETGSWSNNLLPYPTLQIVNLTANALVFNGNIGSMGLNVGDKISSSSGGTVATITGLSSNSVFIDSDPYTIWINVSIIQAVFRLNPAPLINGQALVWQSNIANWVAGSPSSLNAAIANVLIAGGSNGQAILTDGNGNLRFGNVSANGGNANINYVTVTPTTQQIYTVSFQRPSATNVIDVDGDPWTYTYTSWTGSVQAQNSQVIGDRSFLFNGDQTAAFVPADRIAIGDTATGPYNTVHSSTYDSGSNTTTVTFANPFTVNVPANTPIYYTSFFTPVSTPTPAGTILFVGSPTGTQYTVQSQSNYDPSTGTYGSTSFVITVVAGPFAVGTPVYTTITTTTSTPFVNLLAGPNLSANVSNNANFVGNTLYIDSLGGGSNYSNANVANYLPTYNGNMNFAVSNLRVTGGSNGQVLTTNGSGNLSFANSTLVLNTFANLGITTVGAVNSGTTLVSVNGDQRATITAGRTISFANQTQIYTVGSTVTFGAGVTDFSITPAAVATIPTGTQVTAPTQTKFDQVVAGNNTTLSVANNVMTINATGGGGGSGSFANSNSITYNTTSNTTSFSVVDGYIANIALGNASYAYRSDITFPSTSLLNNAAGRFAGVADASRTITANLIVPSTSQDGASTNGWVLANANNTTLTGGTYTFQISDPMVVFDANGTFNITFAQWGAGNTVAGGELNIRPVANLAAGTYPVRVAYMVNQSPALQAVTQSGGTSNANINLTGANVSLGNVGNIKIYGGNNGSVLSTDGTGNLSWENAVTPGIGWSVTVAPFFDTTGGTYVGWSGATQFPVFYANGQVLATSGFTSSTYLGATRFWPTDNAQSLAIFADLYAQWHNTISGALQINTTPVDSFRFTINTAPLATGINPTQSNATVQGLFNLTNPNAGPEFVNSLQYDDASGLYPFQRAKGGAVVYTENLQQVLQAGNIANLGFQLTGANGGISAAGNINFTGANVSLGAVANLKITGGSNTQVLTTDGAGNLSWATVSANAPNAVPFISFTVTSNGNNQQFSNNLLNNYSAANTVNVFKDGVGLEPGVHFTKPSANTIQINVPLTIGSMIDVLASGPSYGGGGGSSGVSQIIAGTNITISPANGVGAVTINSVGSGGNGTAIVNGNSFVSIPTSGGNIVANVEGTNKLVIDSSNTSITSGNLLVTGGYIYSGGGFFCDQVYQSNLFNLLVSNALVVSNAMFVNGATTIAADFTTTSNGNSYFNAPVVINANVIYTPNANVSFGSNVSFLAPVSLQTAVEKVSLVGPQTGTYNFDLLTGPIRFTTGNATANITLNVRGNSTVTANSMLAVEQSVTVTYVMATDTTAYLPTTLQVDGTTQTVNWAGNVIPTGIANTRTSYQYTIIKTATTPTYVVLGSFTRYG